MARIRVTALAIIFALSLLGPAEGAEIEELDSGMLFGGLHIPIEETLVLNSTL